MTCVIRKMTTAHAEEKKHSRNALGRPSRASGADETGETNVREIYAQLIEDSTPGRFEGESPMTAFVNELMMNGDYGEDYLRWNDGSGAARYGRRVLHWSSTGFITLDTYKNVEDAERMFDECRKDEVRDIIRQSDIGELLETIDSDSEPWWIDEANVGIDDIEEEITRQYGPDLGNSEANYYTRAWRIRGRGGVAWRILRPSREKYIQVVMVGDDRKEVVDLDDLEWLDDSDYCQDCGQIGCTWHTKN